MLCELLEGKPFGRKLQNFRIVEGILPPGSPFQCRNKPALRLALLCNQSFNLNNINGLKEMAVLASPLLY